MVDSRPIPRTYGSGPGDPVRLADEPGTWAEIEIAAPSEVVWRLVTDLDVPARFSTEFLGASWVGGGGPALGARFVGRNRHPVVGEWEAPATVDAFADGRTFGWAIGDPAHPGARWRFDLAPIDGGTCLRYSMSIGPGPSGLSPAIAAMPDKEPQILDRRIAEHHANMVRTLEGIKQIAEESG